MVFGTLLRNKWEPPQHFRDWDLKKITLLKRCFWTSREVISKFVVLLIRLLVLVFSSSSAYGMRNARSSLDTSSFISFISYSVAAFFFGFCGFIHIGFCGFIHFEFCGFRHHFFVTLIVWNPSPPIHWLTIMSSPKMFLFHVYLTSRVVLIQLILPDLLDKQCLKKFKDKFIILAPKTHFLVLVCPCQLFEQIRSR